MSLLPCAGCHRLVKIAERACPFCAAARTPSRPPARGPARTPRLSRAAWLAVGPPAVVLGAFAAGCSSGSAAQAGDASAALTAVPFACGTGTCNSGHQACLHSPPELGADHSSCTNVPDRCTDVDPRCLGSCEALHACKDGQGNALYDEYALSCDESDGGALTLSAACRNGCCGCYGCPPARLERMGADMASA